MSNFNDLVAAIQQAVANANGSVTINLNVNQPTIEPAVEAAPAPTPLPDTDFEVGDEVLVCHIRHDGSRVHTMGEVIETCGKDDNGYYTRVLGDNGKHYRTGLKFNEERLGSMIVELDTDM